MKVAAYQAPLLESGSTEALGLISEQVVLCEQQGVSFLCCPEAILGGLADYAEYPQHFAIKTSTLEHTLAPLASDTVTTIVGFTEVDTVGRLFNSAAILHRGRVVGLYRKLHPAINRSTYEAGTESPVFSVGGLTFGVIICRDSTFVEPARVMAVQGATVLFIPTNNGLPANRFGPEVAEHSRKCDTARATENNVYTVRADVVGEAGLLKSCGASAILSPNGSVLASARPSSAALLIADINTSRPDGVFEFTTGD